MRARCRVGRFRGRGCAPGDGCKPDAPRKTTKPLTTWCDQGLRTGCRRRPTLPRPRGRSTIGAVGLNDRVRNGNECGPDALVASELSKSSNNVNQPAAINLRQSTCVNQPASINLRQSTCVDRPAYMDLPTDARSASRREWHAAAVERAVAQLTMDECGDCGSGDRCRGPRGVHCIHGVYR